MLDSQSQAVVDAIQKQKSGRPITLERLRVANNPPISEAHRALIAACEDILLPGAAGELSARVYRPHKAAPIGLLLYFHGGGFVLGGLNTCDGICCKLAALAGCLVVSVDYRLAPEFKFPAGVEDAYAALQWAIGSSGRFAVSPDRIAVGGDSAGGTLSTVACMMARDRGTPLPAAQLLFYPGINIKLESPERERLAALDYLLGREIIDFLNPLYCEHEADYESPYCAPAYANDLRGLPPAMIIAAEFDPLRKENEEYAARLAAANVPTRYIEFPGTIHGFISAFDYIDKGRDALEAGAAFLRSAFNNDSICSGAAA